MDIRDRRSLRQAASASLSASGYNPKKLIFIHTGIALALSAMIMVLDYILEQQIGNTGGLSGLGARSVLETIQTVLNLAQTVALPFWQLGYVYTVLQLSKQEAVAPGSLLQGFRWFGPVLRLELLRGLLLGGIAIVCSYAATAVFILTPWANSFKELLLDSALMENPAALQEAMDGIMSQSLIPLLIIFALFFLPLGVPLLYRYRFANLCLMDAPEKGALSALRTSRKMLRHNCINLLKVDISFWWFYALEIVVAMLCYGDLILDYLGISLPFSATVAYFLFFALYATAQLILHVWQKNHVELTYAHAYASLQEEAEESVPPQPNHQNWEY